MTADRQQYTTKQLQDALNNFYVSGGSASSNYGSADENCAHIYGYNDPNHEMSMLQKITATTMLDYSSITTTDNSSSSPSIEELLERAKEFHKTNGPILPLQRIIQDKSPSMALAAEFKRASPSKGDIAPHINAGDQACAYYGAGACIISILTEERWFKGSLVDLTNARLKTTAAAADNDKTLRPAILRKDFITTTYQIAEAAASGADTILLIVATTPANILRELINYARSIGMEPLVEVHALIELDVALSCGARVIGVNNRNLHTFQLDLSQTDKIAEELTKRGLTFHHNDINSNNLTAGNNDEKKPQITLCALSGMSSSHDVNRYRKVGVGMCLIGESLMRASDPSLAIRGLCLNPIDYEASQSIAGGAYTGGTKLIKVCGITNPSDALVACRSGANLIGVIFAEKSKRKVNVEGAIEIVNAVRKFGERSSRITIDTIEEATSPVSTLVAKSHALELAARRPLVVGVFQNQPLDVVKTIVDECGLDLVQLHGSEGMEAANSKNFGGVPALRVIDIELGSDEVTDDDGGGGEKEEKTSSTSSNKTASNILKKVTSDPIAILLDTSIKGDKHGGGGTGKTFDWTIAESIQSMGLPVIIAGGLTPMNIGEAVGNVRPWGVDVAGGVEASPGLKDHDKVKMFVGDAKKAAVEASKGF